MKPIYIIVQDLENIDNFKTKPTFANVDEYLTYKKEVMGFIKARNKRIDNYANKQMNEKNASH